MGERLARFDTSNQNINPAVNIGMGVSFEDISRNLTKEQMRELAHNFVVLATIRRMFEERQNELANHRPITYQEPI